MSLNTVLNEVKQVIRDIVPNNVEITQVEFEGPLVVIYTKDMDPFTENNDIIKHLAKALRRRVAIRPDPSLLADVQEAEEQINHIIPAEADIQDIYFDHDTGEVSIEALKLRY